MLLDVAADRRKNTDRYLLIATSGGLNQQRTGVSFIDLTCKFDSIFSIDN